MAAISPQQAGFAAAVLKGVGAPATSQNIAGFVGWAQAEGGNNWARNNPLNTTLSAGATGTINSAGVRVYPNAATGVAATVQTLRSGPYGGIIDAFRTGNVKGLASAIGSSPWGTSGSLAAQTISEALGEPVPKTGGIPTPPSSSSSSSGVSLPGETIPITSLDQAAFNQAQARYIAGSAVQQAGTSANPFNKTPGATPGFSSALGGNASNPLLAAKGLLTTTAPSESDYVTTQNVTFAQNELQKLAGVPLATPGESSAAADKILNMARSVLGGPYNQATHATAFTESAQQIKQTGTDCSGFVSWLMGPDGLGVWKQALATPEIQNAPGIQKGPGKSITIYNNPLPGNAGHVFVEIDGNYFQSAGGGAGIQAISSSQAQQMIQQGDNGAPYTALHPAGY